jgi:hypothetical protein
MLPISGYRPSRSLAIAFIASLEAMLGPWPWSGEIAAWAACAACASCTAFAYAAVSGRDCRPGITQVFAVTLFDATGGRILFMPPSSLFAGTLSQERSKCTEPGGEFHSEP